MSKAFLKSYNFSYTIVTVVTHSDLFKNNCMNWGCLKIVSGFYVLYNGFRAKKNCLFSIPLLQFFCFELVMKSLATRNYFWTSSLIHRHTFLIESTCLNNYMKITNLSDSWRTKFKKTITGIELVDKCKCDFRKTLAKLWMNSWPWQSWQRMGFMIVYIFLQALLM